jgi:putative transposase
MRPKPGEAGRKEDTAMEGQSRARCGRSRRAEEGRRPQWSALEEFARVKIQGWIQDLLEEEITELLGREKSVRRVTVDGGGGYRNGYGKPRRVSMMAGTITVRRPRVRGMEERFESQLLPLFVKRTERVAELLPQLYLHGLAEGDFELALRGLLGEGAPLSASSIERLRGKWEQEYQGWRRQGLDDLEVVYAWADGLYVKAGLEDSKAALLVVIGALKNGRKVVLAVESGQRESKESWLRVLRDLRARGLKPWRATVADGHLGIWAALAEIYPESEEQRCWNHRLSNVIDQLPKKVWPEAKELLRKIPYAGSERECERLRDQFVARYGKLYPKAAQTLCRDWERMVTFYRFPADHWCHLRTTNVVESPFAAVRLRTDAGKRYKKVASAEALIWKILMVGEKKFRLLNAAHLLEDVYRGAKFVDGVAVNGAKRKLAA